MTGPTVHLGTFDAEVHWRPAGLAALPALADRRALAQVAVMDELLVGFCAPGDLLVTRRPVPASLRTALAESGIRPDYRSPVEGRAPGEHGEPAEDAVPAAHGEPAEGAVPVERAVLGDPELIALIAGHPRLAPYAVLPATVALARRTGHVDQLPDPAVVAEVNSKSYSTELAHRLGLPGGGRVVRALDDLPAAVAEASAAGATSTASATSMPGPPGPAAEPGVVLLKDPCGVGGRGILEVGSPALLRPILRALRRQVDEGRRVEVVVQPKWRKHRDVSGYLWIDPDGAVTVTGTQVLEHRGVSHVGIGPLPDHLADLLRAHDYPQTLRRIGAAVAETGYRGPLGVDSLLLADGTLVPLLELNARRSMGMLNLALDRRLRRGEARSHLWRLHLTVPEGSGIDPLLDALRAADALHTARSGVGVVPLTGVALRPPHARFECALVCPLAQVEQWRQRVRSAAASVGMWELGTTRSRAG